MNEQRLLLFTPGKIAASRRSSQRQEREFRSNGKLGHRGGNSLLCHCERSAAIFPGFCKNGIS